MIIHRLASAIRRQNWSQIVTEILIVVIGIFLGLQVTDWNEEREDRVREMTYLNRLHSDVIGIAGYAEERGQISSSLEQMGRRERNLNEFLDVLGGVDNGVILGSEHCSSAVYSHTIVYPSAKLPTMNELISSGQLTIIRNEDLKISFSEYSLASETLSLQLDHLASVSLVLARKYPQLIEWDLTKRAQGDRGITDKKCDFENMVLNVAFRNDLADNAAKQRGYARTFILQQEKLQNIHNVLDHELGITH